VSGPSYTPSGRLGLCSVFNLNARRGHEALRSRLRAVLGVQVENAAPVGSRALPERPPAASTPPRAGIGAQRAAIGVAGLETPRVAPARAPGPRDDRRRRALGTRAWVRGRERRVVPGDAGSPTRDRPTVTPNAPSATPVTPKLHLGVTARGALVDAPDPHFLRFHDRRLHQPGGHPQHQTESPRRGDRERGRRP
jgi:hypothetical protein